MPPLNPAAPARRATEMVDATQRSLLIAKVSSRFYPRVISCPSPAKPGKMAAEVPAGAVPAEMAMLAMERTPIAVLAKPGSSTSSFARSPSISRIAIVVHGRSRRGRTCTTAAQQRWPLRASQEVRPALSHIKVRVVSTIILRARMEQSACPSSPACLRAANGFDHGKRVLSHKLWDRGNLFSLPGFIQHKAGGTAQRRSSLEAAVSLSGERRAS